MIDRIVSEIHQIQRIIQDWFTGEVPKDDSNLERLESALDSSLILVRPNGTEVDGKTLTHQIHQAWGARPSVKIWAENIHIIANSDQIAVARFDEFDREDEPTGHRISTVVLRVQEDRVSWLRLHETRVAATDS